VERTYPAHWEADVVLLDGGTAHVRPVHPGDVQRYEEFLDRLSDRTRYFRWFVPDPVLRAGDIEREVTVDHDHRVGLVATVSDEIIGVAVYERTSDVEADVAFTVRDDHQARGVGSILLEHLAAAARERGVERFTADVLPENERMIAVFREAGYRPDSVEDDGVLRLSVDIAPTGEYFRVMGAREQRAEARSVERVFTPRSVAAIGVSPRPGTFGHTIVRNLLDSGFSGEVYVVHPTAESVAGLPAYRSVEDISEPVDLAVIAVPAEIVPAVVAACGRKGVQSVVVISAGFAEAGDEGRERQRELVRITREHGMRLVGPNCLGVINTDPAYRLNTTLAPTLPGHSRVGFFCQSGSLGITLLETVAQRRIGVSTFVAAGNRADVSGNDLLQYWEQDPDTEVVLLYLESIGNPRKFTRLARRLSRHKPVVAMKSGRSNASPLGHLTRPTHLPPAAIDELFHQSGVIQTDTVNSMFDVTQLLAFQPLPDGPRVAVLGNSDALGLLAADACASRGLQLARDIDDLGASAGPDDFERAMRSALADDAVDAVLAIFVPPLSTEGAGVQAAIARVADEGDKPVLATVVGGAAASTGLLKLNDTGAAVRGSVPAYGTVEEAVRALALVQQYAAWRARPAGVTTRPAGLERDRAQAVVEAVLSAKPDGTDLAASTVETLLGCYGIEVWPSCSVADEDAAVEAAESLGYPVMISSGDPRFAHRQDLGSVRTNLESERSVRLAFRGLMGTLGTAAMTRAVVQRTSPPGVPCVISSTEDPLFGPVVSFGLEGVMARLLGDRGYRIPPLSDVEAADLVRTPKAAPLLFGYEGTEPADVAALEDLLVRMAWLGSDLPELAAVHLSPVVVSTHGVAVLGARGRVAPPASSRTDSSVRRLPD
jgi:acyl-CoA synthetase (NDP forming)/GNAT superfamily N-acetyltransferase